MFVSPLLALTSASLACVACVDPQQDYTDYTNRTADAHGIPAITVDASVDTGPLYAPDAGFSSALFYMSCLTGSAEGNPAEASNFAANVKYTPNASGGGGLLFFSNHVLTINPGTLSDTAGMAYTANPATGGTVKPDGTATMTFGETMIPGSANPVNEKDLTFSQTTLTFHIESETQICANLDADLTSPVVMTLTGPCVFRLMPSATAPLPQLQLADFHCP